MKAKKPNAELVWKQLDDLLAPRLRLSVIERTVYAHLLRQPSGRQTPPPVFTYGRGTQYPSFRRSSAQGGPPPRRPRRFAHDPTQQNRALVEVRLPDEIPAAGLNRTARRAAAREQSAGTRAPVNLDGVHFMKNKPLRDSIHAREREQYLQSRNSTRSQ